jgi:hypothetical protein
VSSKETPRLFGQRRSLGTDRSRFAAIHSQPAIKAKMPRKAASRMMASLRNNSWLMAKGCPAENVTGC